jgi:hypothetical protein
MSRHQLQPTRAATGMCAKVSESGPWAVIDALESCLPM